MKFNEYPIVVGGGGNSIPFPDNKPDPNLVEVLTNNIVCGTNYFSLYYIKPTWTSFVDGSITSNFYEWNIDWLKNERLIIGRYSSVIKNKILENTMLVPKGKYYLGKNALQFSKKICISCKELYDLNDTRFQCVCGKRLEPIGIAPSHLSSMFALSLSIALGFKKIFLLGNDGGAIDGKTHFYEDLVDKNEVNYRGVGFQDHPKKGKVYKTSTYSNAERLNNDHQRFGAFKNYKEEGLEIFNISPQSHITIFPRVSYDDFYNLIGNQTIDQEEIVEEIRQYILDNQR